MKSYRFLFFIGLFVFLLVSVGSVFSAEVTVSNSDELVSALNNSDYSVVNVQSGSYVVKDVYINHNVTLNGNSASISGGDSSILQVGYDSRVVLSGFTFYDTNSSDSFSPIVSYGNLSVVNCVFSGNIGSNGGALSVDDGVTSVSGSTFMGNRGVNDGGAVQVNGGTLYLNGCTFISNSAFHRGGAVNAYGDLFISNCVFTSNIGPLGGAVSSNGATRISGSRFTSNSANTTGGAVYIAGDCNISGCQFLTNLASYGGAVSVFPDSSGGVYRVGIFDSVFSSNHATTTIIISNQSYGGTGGAVYVEGSVNITGCTFTGNGARYDGGAISLYGEGGGFVNYNIFRSNSALNPLVVSADLINNVDLDYNWWGSNNPFVSSNLIGSYNEVTDDFDLYVPNNWVVLSLSAPGTATPGSSVNVDSVLKVKSRDGSVSDLKGSLPVNSLTLLASEGSVSPSSGVITSSFTSKYTVPSSAGLYTVTSILDNQEVSVPVMVQSGGVVPVSPGISTEVDTSGIVVEENGTITIVNSSVSIVPGGNVSVNVVSSDFVVNTGTVRLSYNGSVIGEASVVGGVATIPTNLGAGEYKLLAEYIGSAPFNSSSGVITVEVIQPIYRTVIVLPDLVKVYLGSEDLTGVLTLNNGEVIIGHHILLTLTRISSGASKTYDVVSDYNGVFSLPINLAIGEYSASAVFEGYGDYSAASNTSSIRVVEAEDNRTHTTILVSDFSEAYGEGRSYNGTLITTGMGDPVIGHHVTVRLIRPSNGQYKDYDVVTDYTGMFSLPINLAAGVYMAECTYAGTDMYQSAFGSSTITVY